MSTYRNFLRSLLVSAACALMLNGCGGGSTDSSGGTTPAPSVASSGSVSGQVVDAQSSVPIAGVAVQIGGITASTDAQGNYSLKEVPPGQDLPVKFSKDGYANNFATIDLAASQTANADRRLAKIAVKQEVEAGSGGTLTLAGSAAQVQLPADSLVNAASGTVFTGKATVEMTPIDPGIHPLNMPGNYRAQGEALPIESMGALQVEIRDEKGALLNLAPGKTADIRIPLPSGATSPPLSMPLYYFKESTGLWVQEGTAQLAGVAPNQYYAGRVSHFTVWNADKSMETIFINGCVKNLAGAPVSSHVTTLGIGYYGSSATDSDADGKFRIAARRNSTLDLRTNLGVDMDSVTVTTESTDITLSNCLVLAQKPPVISVQPLDRNLTPNSIIWLEVVASAATQYQWYHNDRLIASGSRLHVVLGDASQAGDYYVIASNAFGSVKSRIAKVQIQVPLTPPLIIQPLQNLSVIAGAGASFSVQAQGDALQYQWLRNGIEIPGANGATLSFTASSSDTGAQFKCRVSNSAGSVFSNAASLTVTSAAVAPGIAQQPSPVSVSVGQSATFTVQVTGTAPFSYQWLLNGAEIQNANASSYLIASATLAQSGAQYAVRISNAAGSITSAVASLNVTPVSEVAGLYLPAPNGPVVAGASAWLGIPANGAGAVNFMAAGQGQVIRQFMQSNINAGVSTNAHMRALLFWKNQALYRQDLVGSNGAPGASQVSTLRQTGLCGTGFDVNVRANDLKDATRSWELFRQPGTDTYCGTADDQFIAVRLNMSPGDAPLTIPEPLVAIRSADGGIAAWLVRNGQQIQRVNAEFSQAVTLFSLPGADLVERYSRDVVNDFVNGAWIFQFGDMLYAWDLNDSSAGTPTLITPLTNNERSLPSIASSDGQEYFISICSSGAERGCRLIRYNKSNKTSAQIASMPGSFGIQIELTPSRVILNSNGDLYSLARSGGSAQKIFAGSDQYRWPQLIMVGEKIWLSFFTSNNLLALNSDGSNVQTFSNTQFAGCLTSASISNTTGGYCAQLMVVQNDKLRSIDAVSGALQVEYGSTSAVPAGSASRFSFSLLRTFGQTGVWSQHVYTLANPQSGSFVNYTIKTDRPGITLVTTP